MDVRSKKTEPLVQSEDQEDELLSILSIKGYVSPSTQRRDLNVIIRGTKYVIGTQLGVLSIFNKNSGWRDCVDRVPGYAPPLHTATQD
jgi:hypothetical protein